MAYVPKIFKDRAVEFPFRRLLTPVSGQANTVDVSRVPGTIFEVGDEPDAENLNAEFGKIKTETDSIITSLNDFKTYSTTEKVVGTWINGKPLYRKTVQVTANNQSIGTNIGVAIIDNSHSFVRVDAVNQYLPIHYYTPNGTISWFIICNNGVFTSEGSRIPFGYAGYTTYITVEYTKTTD